MLRKIFKKLKNIEITISDVALVVSIITFIIVTLPKIIMFFS